MSEAGYSKDVLEQIRVMIDAEKSDLLDVLEYIAFNTTPIERRQRAERVNSYLNTLTQDQKMFVDFILNSYILSGITELSMKSLPKLLELKYGSLPEGMSKLGNIEKIKELFLNTQKALYI